MVTLYILLGAFFYIYDAICCSGSSDMDIGGIEDKSDVEQFFDYVQWVCVLVYNFLSATDQISSLFSFNIT